MGGRSSAGSSSTGDPGPPQPKPAGNDLFQAADSFTAPAPLARHPARLAGHLVLRCHALKGQPGARYVMDERTRQWQEELRTEGAKWQQHSLSLAGKRQLYT